MSQIGIIIILTLIVMVAVSFWRQLLLLLLSLIMAVFCLGLYRIVQIMHHG